MKKIIAVIIMLALLMLCACTHREEVSRELIDYDFTPAHSEVKTEYDYKYNVWKGEFQLVPDTHSVFYDDKYELKYRIVYDDESTAEVWEEVTEHEYDNAVKELTGEEG